ncbi:hypothetical protein [Aureimonas sp. ME7]|uniref:hypothetical protein n=1 Tax=Aureimonas sp. ME7 TaxID=2744252 RepID=UPI0015F52080|nr:hypothetical protein [Aureimonas sp. ME7]
MLRIYVRSFHPRENFGRSGLYFSGDNRGFKTDPRATARITSIVNIDLQGHKITKERVFSHPSHNTYSQNKERATENYQDVRTQPTGDLSRPAMTPYREGGDQSFSYTFAYRGKNHAFGQWDWDDANTTVENVIIPDLDVTYTVSGTIRRQAREFNINLTMRGDGFPNAEAIFYDTSGNPLFLVSHIRVGTATSQLFGNRRILMGSCSLRTEWLQGDLLGSSAYVLDARDYAGEGSPSTIGPLGQTTVSQWNERHTGRSAVGPESRRRLDDSWPIPFMKRETPVE